MKILHMVPLINASVGGPSVSVTRLATEQAKLGHEVTLACLDYDHLGPQVPAPGVRLLSQKGNFLAVHGRGWSPSFRRLLREEARRHEVVHDHGLWMWPNKYARCAANEAGKPLVISTRGMVEGWSLRRAVIRKFVAWYLFERKNLESAALFHATSESEAEAIATALRIKMKIKFKEPRIVVAPNGVDIPERIPSREVVERRFPKLRGKKWVLFYSRIHPKKGLDLLLEAWKQQLAAAPSGLGLAPSDLPPPIQGSASRGNENPLTRGNSRLGLSEVVLVIAGADLIGYGAEVERMIREKGLGETVLMTGHVDGEVREALLGHSMFLVLPSHSENFGLVVAESLAAGRPALTTTGTPWGAAKPSIKMKMKIKEDD
ncbi:MAG: glycosyltransferase, partial [Verrucomicrobiota bacterium]